MPLPQRFISLTRRYDATIASSLVAASRPNHYAAALVVPGITPVEGWWLVTWDEDDGNILPTPAYAARCQYRDVLLDTSRFHFTPSQERFAYLVRHAFPKRPTPFGGWDDTELDQVMSAEREAA